jgi:hypothetical protein
MTTARRDRRDRPTAIHSPAVSATTTTPQRMAAAQFRAGVGDEERRRGGAGTGTALGCTRMLATSAAWTTNRWLAL